LFVSLSLDWIRLDSSLKKKEEEDYLCGEDLGMFVGPQTSALKLSKYDDNDTKFSWRWRASSGRRRRMWGRGRKVTAVVIKCGCCSSGGIISSCSPG
jgi:hypothetical protein